MTSMTSTILLPFQHEAMTPAQLAAVSYLARYTGHTHALYAYQLRRWFTPDPPTVVVGWSGFVWDGGWGGWARGSCRL
jgi:hypothetical protein